MPQAKKRRKTNTEVLERSSKKDLWDVSWVREPQQTRSARTRTKLLDAAQKILNEGGPDSLTIGAIAEEAGVSVGLLYHYFQDRQTIIYAVIDRYSEELANTVKSGLDIGRWEGVSLIDILDGHLRFWMKRHRRFPGVIHANRLLAMQDPLIETRMHDSGKKARNLIMQVLRTRFHEVGHPNPEVAMILVLETFKTLLAQRSAGFLPGRKTAMPQQSDEAFIHEMKEMAAGYLQLSED